jgi:hypothetical protein
MITFGGRHLNTYQERLHNKNHNEINEVSKILPSEINTNTQISKISGKKMIGGSGNEGPNLSEIKDNNHRAEIETGITAAIFGVTIAYILYYLGVAFNFLWNVFMILIIFNMALIIYKVIQLSLDISHKVVGGIGKTMQDAVDKAVIPGFNIAGIEVPSIKLLGFLQGPANDVNNANKKFPEKAHEVILSIITGFFNDLTKF